MTNSYQAPTVKKAFRILRAVSKNRHGMGVSELSKRLSIGKSTVFGILNALEDLGAVVRDPKTKTFTLGVTLFELGRAAYSRIDVKEIARPIMESLMERAQESVFLGVRNGEHVTIIDIVESTQDLKITAPVGTRIPLFAGATGKVFMASMTEEKVAELIQTKGISHFTKNTVINPMRFMEEIRTARRKGYATDDEEYISGVRAVAAAIEGTRAFSSAIWVVGFKPRIDARKMEFLVEETLNAAHAISERIQKTDAIH
jgi:DNA-binding IclR family transcriptional regulator